MASGRDVDIILRALRGQMTQRELGMIGLAEDTRKVANDLIALDPALEQGILALIDLVYRDGMDAETLGYTGISGPQEATPADSRCEVCGERHNAERTVQDGQFTLHIGHEYEITTKTSQQRYPRRWRMGFIGRGYGGEYLEFSARGPGRTHSGQYAGTVQLRLSEFLAVTEVERDDSKRHVGEQIREGN